MTTEARVSLDQLARQRTDLSTSRTLMAADRTLMSWVRTALALQSFGFTTYKVLEGFQQAGRVLPREQTPRNVGLFLTAMGVVALVMGIAEYLHVRAELRAVRAVPLLRSSLVMALLMAAMGLLLFFGIITQVL